MLETNVIIGMVTSVILLIAVYFGTKNITKDLDKA
jgi:hypothetical protein